MKPHAFETQRDRIGFRVLWRDAIYGMAVGDALALPASRYRRGDLMRRPILTMSGYGTYNRFPEGTWSSATSLALATTDSIVTKHEVNLDHIMSCYVNFTTFGKYAINGKVVELPKSSDKSIDDYRYGRKNAKYCGTKLDDGGALSRIVPVCMYAIETGAYDKDAIELVHSVASLTNDTPETKVACGIIYFCIKEVVFARDATLNDRVSVPMNKLLQEGLDNAIRYYQSATDIALRNASRHFQNDLDVLSHKPMSHIPNGGGVVDMMTSIMWGLCNGKEYDETVLKLANLGETTTVRCAVAGSIAGIYYGFRGIPTPWKNVLKYKNTLDNTIKYA